jgi:hypothetical protein
MTGSLWPRYSRKVRFLTRLRDRLAHRPADVETLKSTPLSASYRWPALEAEREPRHHRGSASQDSMNGAAALGIHLTHRSPPSS